MTLDRRTFLKTLAASGALPAALHAQTAEPAAAQALAWQPAVCRFCDVGCELLVGIKNGRALAIKGDPRSQVSKGLACAKGYYAFQALYGSDRITQAMVRRNGSLVPVSLAAAYDIIAGKLRDVRQQHGAASVAAFGSGQWSQADALIADRLFRQTLGTRRVDTSARWHAASAAAGALTSFGAPGSLGGFDDLEQAGLIVLWNHNAAEMSPVLFSRILERRRTNRVRVIELATRTTRTSYALDRSILYAPQSELAIANAICQQIVERHQENRAFIADHVGFKAGNTKVGFGLGQQPRTSEVGHNVDFNDYRAFLADYSPRKAEQISGVAPEDISWLASLYTDPALKVVSIGGPEIGSQVRGTWVHNTIANIHLLVGKIGSPGNNLLTLGGEAAALPLSPSPAGDALSIFRGIESGDIRFLWVQGGDPMVSLPNLNRYRRALAAQDRFVVASAAYPTATTDLADVVLPAALWIERAGSYQNGAGTTQHHEQLVAAPGAARSDGAHMIEVARRLGHARSFPQSILREPQAAPSRPRTLARAWVWLRPYQPPIEAPDREYPFWLNIGAVLEHSGTGALTRRIATLHRAVPRAYAELNAADAQRLGIRDGARIRLVSRRGSLELPARINQRSQPGRGQVFVPAFDEQTPVNLLTIDACCPLSGQPAYQTTAVRVERV